MLDKICPKNPQMHGALIERPDVAGQQLAANHGRVEGAG